MRFKLFILIALLFSCRKGNYSSVTIFGHAGNGLTIQNSIYHDNSLESIQFALETEGVFGVEIDVQLSKDGDLWLFHDSRLDNETNSTGCISEKLSEDLIDVHYRTINKERLVRLKDIPLNSCAGKTLLIDVKYLNDCAGEDINVPVFIDEIESIAANNPQVNFIILSKSKYWVSAFQNAGFEVYFEMENLSEYESLINSGIHCEGFILKNSSCTAEDVAFLQQNDKKVIIFDMRAPKPIRKALKKMPDGIITDDIGAALIEKH